MFIYTSSRIIFSNQYFLFLILQNNAYGEKKLFKFYKSVTLILLTSYFFLDLKK